MNDLIKKYATSDDASENSKTQELWLRILKCKEIVAFMGSTDTNKILRKYTITREEHKKRILKTSKITDVNFKLIQDNVAIHSNGIAFYKNLLTSFTKFNHNDKERLESIISSVFKHQDIDPKYIEFESQAINKVMTVLPELFDKITIDQENLLFDTLDYIIEEYNSAINNQDDIQKRFEKIGQKAKAGNIKDYATWDRIGSLLAKGDAPKIADLYAASSLFTGQIEGPEKREKIKIDEELMIKMVEWESRKKILSNYERQNLSDFAYGFKKLNAFHENKIRKYLQSLIADGFNC
jgi:hypothetical protein